MWPWQRHPEIAPTVLSDAEMLEQLDRKARDIEERVALLEAEVAVILRDAGAVQR